MERMKAEAADGGRVARPARGSAAIEGVFPILCTPYCEDGSLDCETLAKEAGFVADCGAQGVIWPPANDALARLDTNELRAGWEAMACALDGRGVRFVACCPGRDTDDALVRADLARRAVAGHPGLPTALLARMADDAKGDADHERHYEALAKAATCPVIIQTMNGTSPMPSAELLVELARRHPDAYGWFKVEGTGPDVAPCKRALVAAKPFVKTVFTGWGGRDWLYDHRRIGTRGVISQRPMYADLMVAIWRALLSGDPAADSLFARFMHLRNLEESLPAPEMRGWNLHVLVRRGVFRNTLSRIGRGEGGEWRVAGVALDGSDLAEINARLTFARLG